MVVDLLRYIVKRIFYMIFVFAIMSVVLFGINNLVPGDPARVEVEALKDKLKPNEYQMAYEQARKDLGLDDPVVERYKRWMGGILSGNLGKSSVYKQPVTEVVKVPLKNTIFINIFEVIIGLGITIPLGIRCAVRKGSSFDKTVQTLTIIGYSIPTFIFGLLFIYVFAVQLRWFPVSGMGTPNFKGTRMQEFLDVMKYLVLPLMVMTIGTLGGITRYVRTAMVDSLSMDYIRTARAKGVKEKVVIYSHAWRNALLPVITLIIGWFMSVFSGSIIVENMFNLNGIGRLLLKSLQAQDYEVVIAIQLFSMLISLFSNFITDLSYGLVDPRVRVSK